MRSVVIFPSAYESKSSYRLKKPHDSVGVIQSINAQLNNFVSALNEAGAQEYKLVSGLYGEIPVGVVRLDGVQYEYESMMTNSILSSLTDRRAKYDKLSKRGFHLVCFSK